MKNIVSCQLTPVFTTWLFRHPSNKQSTFHLLYPQYTKIGEDFVLHFALIFPFRGEYKWWHIWDCAIPISSTFYPTYFIYLWIQAHTLRCFKGNRQQYLNLNNNFGFTTSLIFENKFQMNSMMTKKTINSECQYQGAKK